MSEQTRPLTADILKQFKRIERSGLLTAEINSVYFTLITNHSATHQDTLDVMLIDNAGSIKEPYFDEFTSEEMMDLYDLVLVTCSSVPFWPVGCCWLNDNSILHTSIDSL